jgi:hypothetical protein
MINDESKKYKIIILPFPCLYKEKPSAISNTTDKKVLYLVLDTFSIADKSIERKHIVDYQSDVNFPRMVSMKSEEMKYFYNHFVIVNVV